MARWTNVCTADSRRCRQPDHDHDQRRPLGHLSSPLLDASSRPEHFSEQPAPAASDWPPPDASGYAARGAVAPASKSGAAAFLASQTQTFWVAVGAVVFSAVGVLGTWLNALGGIVSVNGVDTSDGKLALVIALVAGFCLWHFAKNARKSALGVAGVLGVVNGVIAVAYISDLGSQGALVAPGWGLYILMIAAVVLLAACIKLWRDA